MHYHCDGLFITIYMRESEKDIPKTGTETETGGLKKEEKCVYNNWPFSVFIYSVDIFLHIGGFDVVFIVIIMVDVVAVVGVFVVVVIENKRI